MIIFVWIVLAIAYVICKWRQKSKSTYVIPRVFVLCSPRTVQFHYELILRVGLPSYDFNPDKHDIDLTIQGQSKNEVVPTTRINTKTLLDEPLITSLSLVVYRLVEMPHLGGLILRHSGPFKSWVYAYDFTVIDLSTNKERYYTLNQYIGSLNRVIHLDEQNTGANGVQYPIDDVPLPHWTQNDVFLFLYTVINSIMVAVTLLPINCSYSSDIISILLTAFSGGAIVFFLNWFLYYHLKWNQDRKEYFNDYESGCRFCPSEYVCRIILLVASTVVGMVSIYYALAITDLKGSLVWFLTVLNSTTLVIGVWNVGRIFDIGESIVRLGLRMSGIEMVSVGMRYSEMVSELHSKSGSASDDGGVGLHHSGSQASGAQASHLNAARSFGPRSSVKSFGFDPRGHPLLGAKFAKSRVSSTGATPNTRLSSEITSGRRPAAAAAASKQAAKAAGSSARSNSQGSTALSSNALPPSGKSLSESSAVKSVPRSHSSSDSEKRKRVAAAGAAVPSGQQQHVAAASTSTTKASTSQPSSDMKQQHHTAKPESSGRK